LCFRLAGALDAVSQIGQLPQHVARVLPSFVQHFRDAAAHELIERRRQCGVDLLDRTGSVLIDALRRSSAWCARWLTGPGDAS
jgi:hypothetical protein